MGLFGPSAEELIARGREEERREAALHPVGHAAIWAPAGDRVEAYRTDIQAWGMSSVAVPIPDPPDSLAAWLNLGWREPSFSAVGEWSLIKEIAMRGAGDVPGLRFLIWTGGR